MIGYQQLLLCVNKDEKNMRRCWNHIMGQQGIISAKSTKKEQRHCLLGISLNADLAKQDCNTTSSSISFSLYILFLTCKPFAWDPCTVTYCFLDHSFEMLVSLTVGKVDAGVAVLLTQDNRLVSSPCAWPLQCLSPCTYGSCCVA